MKREIRHIGNILAVCNPNLWANLREDLGVSRYKILGVRELMLDETPYRICKRCIKTIALSYKSRSAWAKGVR